MSWIEIVVGSQLLFKKKDSIILTNSNIEKAALISPCHPAKVLSLKDCSILSRNLLPRKNFPRSK